jgi:hypothetical protein
MALTRDITFSAPSGGVKLSTLRKGCLPLGTKVPGSLTSIAGALGARPLRPWPGPVQESRGLDPPAGGSDNYP